MRRLARYTLTVLSLVVCVGTVALWVRSYRHVDLVGREGQQTAGYWQRGGYVDSAAGRLSVEWWVRENDPRAAVSTPQWAYTSWPIDSPLSAPSSWHGFAYEATRSNNANPTSDGRPAPVRWTYAHEAAVPHWLVVGLTALPVWLGVRRRAARRWNRARAAGRARCPECDYDLTGNVSGVCPECGTNVAA